MFISLLNFVVSLSFSFLSFFRSQSRNLSICKNRYFPRHYQVIPRTPASIPRALAKIPDGQDPSFHFLFLFLFLFPFLSGPSTGATALNGTKIFPLSAFWAFFALNGAEKLPLSAPRGLERSPKTLERVAEGAGKEPCGAGGTRGGWRTGGTEGAGGPLRAGKLEEATIPSAAFRQSAGRGRGVRWDGGRGRRCRPGSVGGRRCREPARWSRF